MKKIFKIAIILALTFVIIHIEKDFKNREFFNISEVKINEVSPNLSRDLAKIKTQILGENINHLDLEKLKNKIQKDTRVKSVSVSKKNLNQIEIDVIEKEQSYYIQYNSNIYTMDNEGIIFGKIEEYPRKSTPIFVLKSKDERLVLLEIMEKLQDLDLKDDVSQLSVQNKNLVYIFLRDGAKIKTEVNVTKNRYEVATNLYKNLIKNSKIEYIDIRFKDIVVKEKEGKDAR